MLALIHQQHAITEETMNKNQRHGMKITTHICSGKGRVDPEQLKRELASNQCWVDRNNASVACNTAGWPQHDPNNRCFGNNNSAMLKECLMVPNINNWWKSFPSCQDGGARDCYNNRLGGASYNKCQEQHKARLLDPLNWTQASSIQELGRCLSTIPE